MPRKAPFRIYLEEFQERILGTAENTQYQYAKVMRRVHQLATGLDIPKNPKKWHLDNLKMLLDAMKYREDGTGLKANKTRRAEGFILNRFLKSIDNRILDNAIDWKEIKMPSNRRVNVHWISIEDTILLRTRARMMEDPISYLGLVLGIEVYLRVGEMVNVKLEDLLVSHLAIPKGKGEKPRLIELSPRTQIELKNHIDGPREEILNGMESPYLIVYRRGNKVSNYSPSHMGARLRNLGLMENPLIRSNPHTLRRSGARITYEIAPTDRTVQDLRAMLGHSSTEQTREYIGADLIDQKETLNARDHYLAKMYPEEYSQSAAHL